MHHMTGEHFKRCDKSRPTAVHAQRDIEEQERLRQLGGILVHDLNNAMFALAGRTQLLKRQAQDLAEQHPDFARAVGDVHDAVKLLDSLISKLQSACQRESTGDERSNLRAAVMLGLRHALGTLPEALRPGAEEGFDAWLEAHVDGLPRDLFYEGSIVQVASALAQLIAIHRQRATGPINVCCSVRKVGDDLRFDFYAEDDGGLWEHGVEPPSLLHGTFDLALLPLAAARRATRHFGGTAALERAPTGLRSHLSFKVVHGLALEQHGLRGAISCHEREQHRTRRVLIADDDPTIRALLIAALESVNDDVETIAEPSALLSVPELESMDVVILDAGGGGLEALRKLREGGSTLPVLVVSGDMVEGNFDDHTRFVMKPVPLDRLDHELSLLASRRRR
jgi:CheY-like chemotaxis protein